MATITITRTKTLPDSSTKADFHELVSTASVDLTPGSIQANDLSDSIAIPDSKIAQISTPGKLDGAAFTSLADIPAAAGVIPAANLPTSDSPYPQVNAMGSVSGTIAPLADQVNTATLTGNVTLSMPTPTTGELHTVIFQFTMGSAYTVTVSNLTWNFGATPTYATGTTKNRIALDTIDGGSTWQGYYSQF